MPSERHPGVVLASTVVLAAAAMVIVGCDSRLANDRSESARSLGLESLVKSLVEVDAADGDAQADEDEPVETADRTETDQPVKTIEPPESFGLGQETWRQVQACLVIQGFDPGAVDGEVSRETHAALTAWRASRGEAGAEAHARLVEGKAEALLALCGGTPEPVCTGDGGPSCWHELANQAKCYIWNSRPASDETVTWTGECIHDRAFGVGKVTWRFREEGEWKESGGEGEIRGGKDYHGTWVWRSSKGDVFEGPFVNGKKHGHWVERYANLQVWEGPFVDGEAHGYWIIRHSASSVLSIIKCRVEALELHPGIIGGELPVHVCVDAVAGSLPSGDLPA